MIPEPDPRVPPEVVGPNQIEVDRIEPEIGVVRLLGEHDLHTAEDLRTRIQALVGEGCAVTIDLTETVFLDSSILAVLVEAHEQAASRGTAASVALPGPRGEAVRRVLDVTGLSSTLDTHADLDGALAAARGRRGG